MNQIKSSLDLLNPVMLVVAGQVAMADMRSYIMLEVGEDLKTLVEVNQAIE